MATANTHRSDNADPLDLYNTDVVATRMAIEGGVFNSAGKLWDPCDGLGDMSNVLKAYGFDVETSDKYDHVDRGVMLLDFLAEIHPRIDTIDGIVMNPPFKQTLEFIDRALELVDRVYMFNRASVLETRTRAERFNLRDWPLSAYYQFGPRVNCSKGVERSYPARGAVMYGWYVLDKKHKGDPVLRWLY